MRILKDLTGIVVGKLTVIQEVERKISPTRSIRQWECKCECGNTCIVVHTHLQSKHTLSCGCHKIEQIIARSTTHGCSVKDKDHLYTCWLSMRARCNNPNTINYDKYGGRGIKVCDEWEESFISFKKWADNCGYSKELTIDRINNNLGYFPDNCRWTTATIQARNQRKSKNRSSKFMGVTAFKEKWQAAIRINYKAIHLGTFNTEEDAARFRDNYIISNNLEGFTLNF